MIEDKFGVELLIGDCIIYASVFGSTITLEKRIIYEVGMTTYCGDETPYIKAHTINSEPRKCDGRIINFNNVIKYHH
jgi:hypothetical protein